MEQRNQKSCLRLLDDQKSRWETVEKSIEDSSGLKKADNNDDNNTMFSEIRFVIKNCVHTGIKFHSFHGWKICFSRLLHVSYHGSDELSGKLVSSEQESSIYFSRK